MKYTYYNNNGEIVGNIIGIPAEAEINCPDDCSYIKGEYLQENGYITDGGYVAYNPEEKDIKSSRPGVAYTWDNNTMSWSGSLTTHEIYYRTINEDIVYKDHVYQADLDSLAAMRATLGDIDIIGGDMISWKLKDNTFVDLSVDDLRNIVRMIISRNNEAFKKK